jgi:hypothetical protein
VDHSDGLWAELFTDLYSDEFGDGARSPFPECQASPFESDDEAFADLPTMDWQLQDIAMPVRQPASYSAPRPY